jgi:hypothetical protein
VVTQATVRDWDPDRGGSAYLDDGTVVDLPPSSLEGSAFRFLRLGQRVRLVFSDDRVARVELP